MPIPCCQRQANMAAKHGIGNLTVALGPSEKTTSGKTASPEYRNVLAKDGFCKIDGVSTLYESFQNRYLLDLCASDPCMQLQLELHIPTAGRSPETLESVVLR